MPQHEPASWVHKRTVGGSVVVELRGEIDALVAPRLTSCLDALTESERPDVVLDMRRVTFIDCRGISCLVRVNRRAGERGGRARFICTDPKALRVLRITRLTPHLDILAELPKHTELTAVSDSSPSVDGP